MSVAPEKEKPCVEQGQRDATFYKQFFYDQKKYTELIKIWPTPVFIFGFVPPLCAAVLSITIALIFHNDLISNYNWQCGRAKFPSLSRIINLPLERIIWQVLIMVHIPIRILELMTGFVRFRRHYDESSGRKWLYEIGRMAYFFVGMAELLFLGALSLIGERENTQIHVILFYIFGFCGIGFFAANVYCHRYSLYHLKPYGKLAFRIKIFFMVCYFVSMPILVGAFILYWKQCYTLGYDIFAVCEYLGVLFNIGFHGAAFFDVRDRMVLSVRLVEAVPSTKQ